MEKGKYEQILEEFLTVVAAEIYTETGIECKFNKTDDMFTVIKNNGEEIISINIDEPITIDQKSKHGLYCLGANYAKLIAKDLVIKSKPLVDKDNVIKTNPRMVNEDSSEVNDRVEPILPRNLGIPPITISKMISEVNNNLIHKTKNSMVKVGDKFTITINNAWDLSIIKEHFEKTGYWKITSEKSHVIGSYFIFEVLKV